MEPTAEHRRFVRTCSERVSESRHREPEAVTA